MNANFENLGFYPADILLPKTADMSKWAVIACDQFTSQPEYWEAVEDAVGDAPSTLRMILPEAHLGDGDAAQQIANINDAMAQYIEQGIFQTYYDALFYIERTQTNGRVRRGLIGMIDLEHYDFTPGCGALIRATEATVFARIPPRIRVRQNAPLELPHVMVLIDDPDRTVIEPLADRTDEMESLYDFELQQGGGHLKGWKLTSAQMESVSKAMTGLAEPEEMERKYGIRDAAPLLFAVGDGNHSLATAKQCYENLKEVTPKSQWIHMPARYALVEVVNNHDPALQFEPIHRVLFQVSPEKVLDAFRKYYPAAKEGAGSGHVIDYTWAGHSGTLTVPHPKLQLPVGTLQCFIDDYIKQFGGEVDYIHGEQAADELGSRPNSIAFKLPAMGKELLFKTVIADGVLPQKTFSMGRAQDKRYYVEARRLK